jgi:hypothetical protein
MTSTRLRQLPLLSLFLLATGCASPNTDFSITQKYAGPPLVGFGAQMNAYLYYGHNWNDHEVNDRNISDLEAKVVALKPQHVRIFIQPEWWTGGPDIRESILRTLALAKNAGATVNLTYWHGPWPDIQRQVASYVAMIRDLRDNYGFTNIQYATIQNEPNLHNFDKARYVRIYRALDEELRRANLRDHIKIIGGDLVYNAQVAWFRTLSDNLSGILDGYSIHMYQDYWDTNRQLTRMTEVTSFVNDLPKEGRKDLYLMEFGLRGVRQGREEPGKHRDGRELYDTNDLATLQAWRMLECLNRGYVAFVWWDMMDVMYDRDHMHYGLIGEPSKGLPLKPGYHLMALFTYTSRPGWRAREIDGFKVNQTVSALEGDHGELTVYQLNRATTSQTITISGLPPNTTFRRIVWNDHANGDAIDVGEIRTSWLGSAQFTAPPLSMTALTNLAPGE